MNKFKRLFFICMCTPKYMYHKFLIYLFTQRIDERLGIEMRRIIKKMMNQGIVRKESYIIGKSVVIKRSKHKGAHESIKNLFFIYFCLHFHFLILFWVSGFSPF